MYEKLDTTVNTMSIECTLYFMYMPFFLRQRNKVNRHDLGNLDIDIACTWALIYTNAILDAVS